MMKNEFRHNALGSEDFEKGQAQRTLHTVFTTTITTSEPKDLLHPPDSYDPNYTLKIHL